MSKFEIDFFELLFLAEVCKPPRPIARAMFFQDLCDNHYHTMSANERLQMFEFIGKDLNLEYEDARYFIARFNPENQYIAICFINKNKENIPCFFYEGKYHISKNQSINEEYIKYVTKNKMIDGSSLKYNCSKNKQHCVMRDNYSCIKCKFAVLPM
jgi:hypothetical protein